MLFDKHHTGRYNVTYIQYIVVGLAATGQRGTATYHLTSTDF